MVETACVEAGDAQLGDLRLVWPFCLPCRCRSGLMVETESHEHHVQFRARWKKRPPLTSQDVRVFSAFIADDLVAVEGTRSPRICHPRKRRLQCGKCDGDGVEGGVLEKVVGNVDELTTTLSMVGLAATGNLNNKTEGSRHSRT